MACFSHSLCLFGWRIFCEGGRQRLISSLPKVVEVEAPFFGYTVVQRFRQAGVEMSRGADAVDMGVWDWGFLPNMPRKDPVTQRVALPSKDEIRPRYPKQSIVTYTDLRTGVRFTLNCGMEFLPSNEDWAKALFAKGKLRALIDNFPHVLWD